MVGFLFGARPPKSTIYRPQITIVLWSEVTKLIILMTRRTSRTQDQSLLMWTKRTGLMRVLNAASGNCGRKNRVLRLLRQPTWEVCLRDDGYLLPHRRSEQLPHVYCGRRPAPVFSFRARCSGLPSRSWSNYSALVTTHLVLSRVEAPSVPVAEVLLSLSRVGLIVVDPNSQASGIDDRLLGTDDPGCVRFQCR